MQTQSGRIVVALGRLSTEGADAARIADAVAAMWRKVDAALAPIIGHGSVTVLYMRSLHLVEPAHPWLAGLHDSARTTIDLQAFREALAAQDRDTAAAAGGALLQTYYELLSSLVGPSLTERLLRFVWDDSFSGPPAQDTSP